MVQAKRYRPSVTVTFSTEKGDITLRAETTEVSSLSKEILNVSTNNDLNVDAGTFQITLPNKNRWDLTLGSNDKVIIQMKRYDDETISTVMVGLVDDVRRTVTVQGTTPQRTVTITGRTFAKALMNFEVGVVQETNMTTTSMGWLAGRVTFAGQSAASIVEQLWAELIFKYMNYEFNDGKKAIDVIDLQLSSRPNEKLFDEKSFINYQGSMQSFLREVSNEPFNQMYWESYDNEMPSFVFRETPFNPKNWNDLPLHIVEDKHVINPSIGKSDIEAYALFSVGMQNFFSTFDVNQTMDVFPLWHEPYFKKFGLRRLHRYTGYVGYADGGDVGDSRSQLQSYQQDLYNWNILNPRFYNGFLTVIGESKYKIGDRLLYLSLESGVDIEFFIESVSHEFDVYGSWITRLGVTRGLPKGGDKRFEAPWGVYTDYEGGALGEPSIQLGSTTGSTVDGNFTLPTGGATGTAATILQYAQSFVGKTRYVFGGGRSQSQINSGIFDCSSWVHYVFKQNGIILGSDNPANVNTDVIAKQGQAVNGVSNMQPGDLVFFNTYKHNGHIGIYMGGDQWIGCQTSHGVKVESLNGSYYKSKLSSTIRRVL